MKRLFSRLVGYVNRGYRVISPALFVSAGLLPGLRISIVNFRGLGICISGGEQILTANRPGGNFHWEQIPRWRGNSLGLL